MKKNSLKAILFLALVTFNYPVLSADGDSVELEEVLSLSDRIVVMFDGNIVGEKVNKNVTDRELGLLMAGVV